MSIENLSYNLVELLEENYTDCKHVYIHYDNEINRNKISLHFSNKDQTDFKYYTLKKCINELDYKKFIYNIDIVGKSIKLTMITDQELRNIKIDQICNKILKIINKQ